MKKFGDVLRKIRDEKEVTLKTLGEAIKKTVPYISDVERGRRDPFSTALIEKIAVALDVDPDGLLNAAELTRGKVTLELTGRSKTVQETALELARAWNDLSDEQAELIKNILKARK